MPFTVNAEDAVAVDRRDRDQMIRGLLSTGQWPEAVAIEMVAGLPDTDGALQMLARHRIELLDGLDEDTPPVRLAYARGLFKSIIDRPDIAVALARTGLDFCDLTAAQRAEMRGDAN